MNFIKRIVEAIRNDEEISYYELAHFNKVLSDNKIETY
jgi:hypothetical protein